MVKNYWEKEQLHGNKLLLSGFINIEDNCTFIKDTCGNNHLNQVIKPSVKNNGLC